MVQSQYISYHTERGEDRKDRKIFVLYTHSHNKIGRKYSHYSPNLYNCSRGQTWHLQLPSATHSAFFLSSASTSACHASLSGRVTQTFTKQTVMIQSNSSSCKINAESLLSEQISLSPAQSDFMSLPP